MPEKTASPERAPFPRDGGRHRRWEAAKSIALALLVLTSLLLSIELWWGAAGSLTGGELWHGREEPGPRLPPWSDVIRPTRLVLHLGGDKHAIAWPGSPAYERIWRQGCLDSGLWGQMDPPGKDQLRDQDLRAVYEAGMAVEVLFPHPLPWSLLERAYGLGGQGPDQVEGFLLVASRSPFAAVRQGGRYYRVPGAEALDYRPLAEAYRAIVGGDLARAGARPATAVVPPEGWEAEAGIFVPAVGVLPALVPGMSPPSPSLPEKLGWFFADPGVVRRIEERDGATIFTDGRSGLRLYPGGDMEYNAPAPADSRADLGAASAVSAAVTFMASHGGCPEGVFWWGCWPDRTRGTWTVGLALAEGGLPVLAPGGTCSLVVGTGGVQEMRYAAWQPWKPAGEKQRLMTVTDALARWRDEDARKPLGAGGARGPAHLQDAYLAYLGRGSWAEGGRATRLVPVWVLRVGGGTWAVDAVNGAVIRLGGAW